MSRFILVSTVVLALGACATPQTQTPGASESAASAERQKQQEILFKANVDAARRVAELADGMVIKGADLCGTKTAPRIGLRIWSAQSGDGKLAPSLRSVYGLSDDVSVFAVGRDSPASRGGLRQGDQILTINGWSVPTGPSAIKETEDKLKAEVATNKPIQIGYRRAGREQRAMVSPATACAYSVVLSESTQINAYADGEKVVVARGIVEALQKDEELAFVIGHELGHNIMGHIDARKQNAVVGGVGGAIVDVAFAVVGVNTGGAFTKIGIQSGAGAFSVGFEQEADYVGLYIVALSGYNFAEAPNVWRRMAVLNPASINLSKSHPTTPERFVALEGGVKEIQEKKARGQPMRPNLKPKPQPIPESDRANR
jgi:hypothetical protein